MRKAISVCFMVALLAIGAMQYAEPQSVGGVPGRLRLVSLGVGGAAPAGTGNITATGTVTGATLAGAYGAAGLTGSIADARLSANVALLNGGQNFTGTPPTIGASRVNTIANAGRIAVGVVNGGTGALTNSFNVTSSSRTGTGAYSVNLTAAGFTAGNCVVTSNGLTRMCVANASAVTTTLGVSCVSDFASTLADATFGFVCAGP